MTKDLIERLERFIKNEENLFDNRRLMQITVEEANSILWGNSEYVMSQVPAMARMVQKKMSGDAQ